MSSPRQPTAAALKKPPFKKHPLTIALQACCYTILGGSPLAVAAPTGGEVVGGNGAISQSGTNTTINQNSQNMAINWQTFNVAANERVQFIQPNASAVALNRILSNNGSTIAGRIDANGKVILVNPNGIFFTSTASLNVGSLIASGLNINPADFMNGNYIFNEIPGSSGTVINNGMINASLGGNVALIGKRVENNGLIVANLGSVTLAAGKQAVLTFDQGGLLGVRVSQEILQSELGVDPAVINSGEIRAQGGRVLLTASQAQDIFTRAVNTTGAEPATSVVIHDDGTFTLGGGADVLNSGTIDTSTTAANQNAGRIVLLGENVTSSGTLKADAQSGNGGEIELHAKDTTLLTQNSLTSARSEANGNGGIVKVLGDKVGLFNQSTVDVSGANGGGQALIGGDFQGKNTRIRNARRTYVSKDSTLYADALQTGNGGKIINWGNEYTWFYGSAFARGGNVSGDGGLVEISGKGLSFDGKVDTSAVNGVGGTVLFDPMDIVIHSGSGRLNDDQLDNDDEILAGDAPGTTFNISEGRLESIRGTADIRLEATNNITINDLGDNSLNLGNVTDGTNGSFTIQAGGTFSMFTGDTIFTQGVNVSITAAAINMGGIDTSRRGGSAGGAITLLATTGNLSATSLNSNGGTANSDQSGRAAGNISVSATNGAVSITGLVSANGSNGDNNGNTLRTGGNAGTVSLAGTSITIGGNISSVGGDGGNGGAQGNGNDISFTGPVILGASSVDASGNTRGDILFGSTLNSLSPGTPQTLTLTGHNVTFRGVVGGTAPVGNLRINAAGAVSAITDALIPVLNAINANSLNVASSTSFTSGTINTFSATAAGGTVDIASSGAVNVASVNSRSTLANDGATTVDGGAVAINGDTVSIGSINSSSTAFGSFGGTVNINARQITLNGDIDARGVVVSRIANLSLTNSGSVRINHLGNFTSSVSITGSGGAADTLYAANQTNTWALTSSSAAGYGGTLTGGITFSGFEALAGNNGSDTVNLALLGARTVDLRSAGFSSIENINANGTSTLRALDNQTNNWVVDGANRGTLNQGPGGITFTGFSNLVGGNVTDNFTVGALGRLASLDGGGGANNTLTINGATGSVMTLSAGSFATTTAGAPTSGAGYSNINTVTANSGGATILGAITVDTLVVNSAGNITDSAQIGVTNLTLNTPGTITLDAQDSITGGTFTANSIVLNTNNGIDGLTTTAANLDVRNQSGNVSITNNGNVNASVTTGVTALGNINFTNNNGNITIRQLNAFGGAGHASRGAATYGGHINLTVNGGSAYSADPSPSVSNPVIVAQTFTGVMPGGDFGQRARPMSVMVKGRFSLLARRAFYQFGIPAPSPVDINADVSLSFDSIGFNGRLLEIDSLDEFDPAIFTEIRNYYHEDVAILMPADQRLDGSDEEEKEEEKEGKL